MENIKVNDVLALNYANVNGDVYFGDISDKDDVITLKDVIEINDNKDIEEDVKVWACAKLKGILKSPKIGGDGISFNLEELTAEEKLEIETLIPKINMAINTAVVDIVIDKITQI